MKHKSPVDLTEFNRTLRSTLLLPVALLAILAGLLVWQFEETLYLQRRVDHQDQIISRLNTLERLAVDQETDMRGFQLSGLFMTLGPFHQAQEASEGVLRSLHKLCAGDPTRLADLNRIEWSLRSWQGFAESAMGTGANDQARSSGFVLRGKSLMDALREQISVMVRTEATRRDDLAEQVHRRVNSFLAITLALALSSGLVIGIFTSSRLRRVSSAYDVALHQLHERNDELAGSRQRLLATLESIGDAVISCDGAGRVRYMNAVAQDLTEWPLAEASGKRLEEVAHLRNERTHEPVSNVIEESRQSQSLRSMSANILVARGGTEHTVECTITPVREIDDAEGAVVVLRDMTELRRAQASLIANEKLAVTGRLAASIAHEIHNPLDSVANLHYLLSKEQNPRKRAEFLALAQQELGRTLQISRAMLSLYREPHAPVVVNLKDLIGSVLLLLDRKLKDSGVTVEERYEAKVEVQGFPGELRQVFTNLIANGAEAAGPNGRIRIRLRAASAEDGPPGAVVEIADSGPGIAANVEKRLFQPFITTKGERGTGLGLWVSLGIVQKHGGTVRIANGRGSDLGGAVAQVYLPETAVAFEANTGASAGANDAQPESATSSAPAAV
jgi:PAS domain S-box-containing protein